MLKRFIRSIKSSSPLFLICGGVVLLTFIFVLVENKTSIKKSQVVDKDKIVALFDNIRDNYTLRIEENKNDVSSKYIYYRDSKIELFEKNNDTKGYIKYNSNHYKMLDNGKLIKLKEEYEGFNNYYTDYNIIKGLINKCNFNYINLTNVSCELNVKDYFDYINSTLNKTYNIVSEEKIFINVAYFENINTIKIDYSNAIKEISDDEKLVYLLKISNINKNDFSKLIDYYKDVLEK